MSRIKNENYITIQGWMINELDLKGNELIIYAVIYSFSQAENQIYNGSLQYLADWTNSTKQGVMKNLKSLVEKGLIVKNDKLINGVKFCEYYATKFNGVLNKVEQGSEQSLTEGIKHSLPNNIYSISDNNIDNNKKENNNIVPYEEIVNLFHKICISYSKIIKLSDSRKKIIKARYLEYEKNIDIFKELFIKAEASNFLKGNNDNNWSANFDWLINPSNMIKVLEGNYDNKEEKKNESSNRANNTNGSKYNRFTQQ